MGLFLPPFPRRHHFNRYQAQSEWRVHIHTECTEAMEEPIPQQRDAADTREADVGGVLWGECGEAHHHALGGEGEVPSSNSKPRERAFKGCCSGALTFVPCSWDSDMELRTSSKLWPRV